MGREPPKAHGRFDDSTDDRRTAGSRGDAMRRLMTLVLAAVLGLAAWQIGVGAHIVPDVLSQPCTVARSGDNVTVTISGPGAQADCQASQAQGAGWYIAATSGGPVGYVVCQQTVNGVTWTLRDTGMAIDGGALCAAGIVTQPGSMLDTNGDRCPIAPQDRAPGGGVLCNAGPWSGDRLPGHRLLNPPAASI